MIGVFETVYKLSCFLHLCKILCIFLYIFDIIQKSSVSCLCTAPRKGRCQARVQIMLPAYLDSLIKPFLVHEVNGNTYSMSENLDALLIPFHCWPHYSCLLESLVMYMLGCWIVFICLKGHIMLYPWSSIQAGWRLSIHIFIVRPTPPTFMKGFQWNFQILFTMMWSSVWQFLFLNRTSHSRVISPWLSKFCLNFLIWLTPPTITITITCFGHICSVVLLFVYVFFISSFPVCYSAEVAPLVWVLEGGVPLEHLISCVPGIEIMVTKNGVKKVSWAENKPPATIGNSIQVSVGVF